VIAFAYSHDRCCQLPKKICDLTGNSPHGDYRILFAVVVVSLKQLLKLYCFYCSKNDLKEHSLAFFAIIAGPTCYNCKRTLLLAAFDVSSCFARRELTKSIPGLNRP